MLNKYFVVDEDFDKHKASFFSRIMKERSEGDYSDFLVYDEKFVSDLIKPTSDYIEYIQSLITKFYNENL